MVRTINNIKASEMTWMQQKDLFHSLSEHSWELINGIYSVQFHPLLLSQGMFKEIYRAL